MSVIAVFCTVILFGCGSPDDQARWSAEKAVSLHLKDTDSAKFKDEFIVRKPEDKNGFQNLAVCGVVDGKNSFGAYTGGSRFVVSQVEGHKIKTFDTISVAIDDGNQHATLNTMNTDHKETVFESVYWNKECVDSLHPPMYTGKSDA